MTGEELVQSLLERIAARKERVGEQMLTLSGLQQLLGAAMVPLEKRGEPGYPKPMTKPRPSLTPWNPSLEVPEKAWANDRAEEEELRRRGFSASTGFSV